MPAHALALLSGGLDSMLAIRILQEQGVEVEAVNFRTMFTCCQDTASQAARRLGVKVTVIAADEDYLKLIRKPKYGYGRGANPCVDCRIFMFQHARQIMEDTGASMVVSGEVLGQRPKSQKRRDLHIIEYQSGLEGRLLRPLSAKRLPPTIPEQTGQVDREKLYDFVGRSRKGLISLARQFGFPDEDIPSPSTGCMLTESTFAPRVFDLFQHESQDRAWDFEVLKVGRHLRLNSMTKAVVGRRAAENETIEYLARREDSQASAILRPENFSGPAVMLIGPLSEDVLGLADGLILRFSNDKQRELPRVWLQRGEDRELRVIRDHRRVADVATL